MYQNNQKTQCFKKLKMIRIGNREDKLCLICFKKLGKRQSFRTMIEKTAICDDCLSHFERSSLAKELDDVKVRALYRKNDFIEELYKRYANMYDYALKDAFIIPVKKELKKYRSDYHVVTLADSEKVNQTRLFDADLSIAQCFAQHCFSLRDDQSIDAAALKGADVLLFVGGGRSFDDLKTAIRCIQIYQPHRLAALLLYF